MSLRKRWLQLILLFSATQTCLTTEGRGFTGTETNAGIWVGSQAKAVLESPLTTVFIPVIYIFVFVVGLPTNALALWVFLFRTKKRHPSSIYMANLALADLLFVIWVPLKIAYHLNGNNWTYGHGLCKVLVAFFYGNMYCSMAFIACISVQRYWAVVYPMSQRQRSTVLAVSVSVTIWVLVWLLTIPLYLYDQEVNIPNMYIRTCHDVTRPSQTKTAAGYFLTMGTLGFVVPTVVCIISYIYMLKALQNSMGDPTIAKKRRKAVVLIITVLLMFIVCFTPSNIMLLVHYILLLGEVVNNGYGFYITTLCLASLNSCLDPFVYYFISEDFREHVKNVFLCRSQRTVERNKVSFSALKFSKKSNTYTSSTPNTQSSDFLIRGWLEWMLSRFGRKWESQQTFQLSLFARVPHSATTARRRISSLECTDMDSKWILSLLLVIGCAFAVNAQKGSRGFFGRKNKDEVVLDPVALATLKSSLTTVFFPIIYTVVFVVGLTANGMAIWVFLFRTKKKYPSSIYMANLALADLLFVVWMPLKISYHVNGNNWFYGEPLCKVLVSFFYGNMYCSVLFIACLSVQRYWVVAHPLSTQRKNNKVAIGVCVAVWAFIWITSIPLYLYNHTAKIKDTNMTTCHDVNVIDSDDLYSSIKHPLFYFMFMGTVAFFVPCIVIIVAYTLLLKTLGNSTVDSNATKTRSKAIVLILVVLVTFLVCFIPSNIMLVVHYALLKAGVENNGYGFYITTLCLASLNSCLDPFIYYFVSEEFREHVKNTLLCRSSRTVEREKATFSSLKYSKKSKSFVSGSTNTESSTC
ncbi:uncharacterized protein FYW61_015333 [Anableps anableps]